MTVRDEVSIAGVPWPVYKLLALASACRPGDRRGRDRSAAPSVLAAAAAGTVVWLALRPFHPSGR